MLDDIFELYLSGQKAGQEIFWSELYKRVMKVTLELRLSEFYRETARTALERFALMEKEGQPYPYHLSFRSSENDVCAECSFILQFFQTEASCSGFNVVETCIIPFPGKQYHVFHIHADGLSPWGEEIDVFTPHFLDQYARRSPKTDAEAKYGLPKTLHFKKQPEVVEHHEKEYMHLFNFLGKFFGRNKINRMMPMPEGWLKNSESTGSDVLCLWPEGCSCVDNVAGGKVWLNKTFIPYMPNEEGGVALKSDQAQLIIPNLLELLSEAGRLFPNQYGGSFNTFVKAMQSCMRNFQSRNSY